MASLDHFEMFGPPSPETPLSDTSTLAGERPPEIEIPTLVVHGRRDPFFPVGNGDTDRWFGLLLACCANDLLTMSRVLEGGSIAR